MLVAGSKWSTRLQEKLQDFVETSMKKADSTKSDDTWGELICHHFIPVDHQPDGQDFQFK